MTDKKTEIKNQILAFFAAAQVIDYKGFVRSDEYKGFWINDDEVPAYRYSDIQEETQRPLGNLKILMKEMRNDGLVELVTTIDSVNYAPCGSGWFITYKGLQYVVDNNLVSL